MLDLLLTAAIVTNSMSLAVDLSDARHQRALQVELVQRGRIVSVSDTKLAISDQEGKNEKTYMITKTAKILLDGKGVSLADLKKGDSVTVTLAEGVVTLVEAVRAKPAGTE